MSITNLKLLSGNGLISASWTISGAVGNAIIVKWRVSGTNIPWRNAAMREIAPTSIAVTITGLKNGTLYDIQITQVQYEPGGANRSAKPSAPPGTITLPTIREETG